MILELALAGLVATSSTCGVVPKTPCEAALTITLEKATGAIKKRRLERDQCNEDLAKEETAHKQTATDLAAIEPAADPFPYIVASGAVGIAIGAVGTALIVAFFTK